MKTYNDGTGDGIAAINPPVPDVSLLSIDAWREDGGWTWNDWYRVARVPVTLADLKPRALLKRLRDDGYLRADSAGRCAIEDDGYNVVILARGTRKPLFAIAYGEVQS